MEFVSRGLELIKTQIVSSEKFILKEKAFKNVIVIFIYKGESSHSISLKNLVNFVKETLGDRQVVIYPCFSKKWKLEKTVLEVALKLYKLLVKSGVKVEIVHPSYDRSFTLIPSPNRYLILEAEIKYNQR